MAAVTPEQVASLRTFVGASSSISDETLTEDLQRASDLVDNFIGSCTVPASERAGSINEVAAELFHRRSAPNGISQFADGSGNPVRVARDPMVAAYRTLAPYCGMGIG